MNKLFIPASLFFFNLFYTQNCENLRQHITSYGYFNISFEQEIFNENQETPAEVIEFNEQNNPELLQQFQRKFPEIYDGKCLKTKVKNSSDTEFFFCDKSKIKEVPEDRYNTFGTFQLTFVLDDYYFFKYSGFEIGGYLMYDSKNNLFYHFCSKPIISKDKNYIYSYEGVGFGFTLNLLQLNDYRELSYGLSGRYDIVDIKLTQYKNTDRYSILLNLKEKRQTINEMNEVTSEVYCSRKIRID